LVFGAVLSRTGYQEHSAGGVIVERYAQPDFVNCREQALLESPVGVGRSFLIAGPPILDYVGPRPLTAQQCTILYEFVLSRRCRSSDLSP